ncbi:cellulase family glycosylhydrolase [Eisenbergiella tayi]|uniref:Sugar-binding cellulase-like protein n=1 Tax=Eisenbergiella tayi TaxID=1432052 RepID=A0A1E3A2R5_9FIRM|nr:cellulase family glycosylhydrolase [Eisenbergiella tayi]ODM03030.1 Sugar-binding cellulase-like protein [Eisenbergiella tayi]
MGNRWSKEKINAWYEERPWLMGCNYVPAVTLHNTELWQDDTREEVLASVKEELKLLRETGLNSVRMFMPFHAWYFERERFFGKLDELLALLEKFGVTFMPVLFNDCAPFERPDPVFPEKMSEGWQPYDIGHHGGKAENPFTGEKRKTGWILFDEEEWREPQYTYAKEIISRYARDPRIIIWDLWNEPGNSNRHSLSMGYLERVFEIARDIDPDQPLTAAPWSYPNGYGVSEDAQLEPIQKRAVELSDIVSFHQYENFERVRQAVNGLSKEGRPLINTEWLNRILDNNISELLPYFYENRIGSYHWGLVAGKSQFYLPWDYLREEEGLDLTLWQHDLYHEDFTAYDEKEIALFQKFGKKE